MADAAQLLVTAAPAVEVGLYQIYALAAPVTASTDRVVVPLDLPSGAIVDRATVTIDVAPAGRTPIGDVARVRPATGESAMATTELVIDFGGLRTVSTVAAPASITSVRPWLGTAFAAQGLIDDDGADVSFTEVVTERLLLTLASAVAPASLAAEGSVTMTTAPADVEVLVAGERAHLVPGPVRGPDATHAETIDVTAAVAAAVAAGVAPVEVELRTSVPGRLSVTPEVAYLDAHRVRFPEGGARTVVLAEEGGVDVALPLPPESGGWRVRLIRFDLASDAGDLRVIPPAGPAVTADAELAVDPTQPFAVRLPPAHLRRLTELHAIRLLVAVDQPTELGGFLCDAEGDGPGAPLPGGDLVPTTIAVAAPRWVTLPLTRPLALDPDAVAWAVVQPARGSARIALAAPASDPAEDAAVRRPAGGGLFRPLPTVAGVATTALPLRVAGVPPATAPIAAVEIAAGGDPATTLALTPTPTAETWDLAPVTALTAGSLLLRLTAAAPGAYTVGAVTVGYEEDA